MNQLINDEAVCRTAPATPGLLIIANPSNKHPIISMEFQGLVAATGFLINVKWTW